MNEIVYVVDPHATIADWTNAHAVVGLGNNYNEIQTFMRGVLIDIESRGQTRAYTPNAQFEKKVILIDEIAKVAKYMPENFIANLLNARKENYGIVAAGQSLLAEAIGLKNQYSQIANFDCIITTEYNKLTNKAEYKIDTKPNTTKKLNLEILDCTPIFGKNYNPAL